MPLWQKLIHLVTLNKQCLKTHKHRTIAHRNHTSIGQHKQLWLSRRNREERYLTPTSINVKLTYGSRFFVFVCCRRAARLFFTHIRLIIFRTRFKFNFGLNWRKVWILYVAFYLNEVYFFKQFVNNCKCSIGWFDIYKQKQQNGIEERRRRKVKSNFLLRLRTETNETKQLCETQSKAKTQRKTKKRIAEEK